MIENLNCAKERPLIDLLNNDLSKLSDDCFDQNNLLLGSHGLRRNVHPHPQASWC